MLAGFTSLLRFLDIRALTHGRRNEAVPLMFEVPYDTLEGRSARSFRQATSGRTKT